MIYIEYLVLAILVVYLSDYPIMWIAWIKRPIYPALLSGESCWLQSPHCLNYSPH